MATSLQPSTTALFPQVGDKINHLTVVSITADGLYDCRCDCGTDKPGLRKDRFWTPENPSRAHVKTCGRECKFFVQQLRERKTIHGDAPKDVTNRHPFYEAYHRIKQRCSNPKNPDYKRYGGKGVGMHKPWASRQGYLLFLKECAAFPSPYLHPLIYSQEPAWVAQDAKAFYDWFTGSHSDIPADSEPSAADVKAWADQTSKDRAWLRHWSVDRIRNVLDDGSPGSYVPGNVRLLPPAYQNVNRESTLKIDGVPLVDKAREKNLPPRTVAHRYRNGDNDPFRPLTKPANHVLDNAVVTILSTGMWKVDADGRIVDAVRNAPVCPYRRDEYLVVKLPRKVSKPLIGLSNVVPHHRVVAIAHHGLPEDNRWYCHHKNQVTFDNHRDNLEWMTSVDHASLHATLLPIEPQNLERLNRERETYYTDRSNYNDLLAHRPEDRHGINSFTPIRVLNKEFVEDLIHHHIATGGDHRTIVGCQEVLLAILSAPGNAAEKSPNALTILVSRKQTGEMVRIPFANVKKTHYVYWACLKCGYQSDKRKELREQFTKRDINAAFRYHCDWCQSIALTHPDIAPLVAEFGKDGISPFFLAAGSKKNARFFCRFSNTEVHCTSDSFERLVKDAVNDKGPICDVCRATIRCDNLLRSRGPA